MLLSCADRSCRCMPACGSTFIANSSSVLGIGLPWARIGTAAARTTIRTIAQGRSPVHVPINEVTGCNRVVITGLNTTTLKRAGRRTGPLLTRRRVLVKAVNATYCLPRSLYRLYATTHLLMRAPVQDYPMMKVDGSQVNLLSFQTT